MGDFSLLETILFVPNEGFYLLEGHLKRLQNSIQDFRKKDSSLFPKDISSEDIVKALDNCVPKNEGFQRVRLLVKTDSDIVVEYTTLPIPSNSFSTLDEASKTEPQLSVILDCKPLSTLNDDMFLLNKTTKRDIYELSRQRTQCDYHATLNRPFDVILYNQNNEITETSIANIAIRFIVNGSTVWKTPKLSSGLLPGVFRSYLLHNENNLVEDTITINDLKYAQKEGYPIVCFNSIRKAYRYRNATHTFKYSDENNKLWFAKVDSIK